jgi:hypothetical protein
METPPSENLSQKRGHFFIKTFDVIDLSAHHEHDSNMHEVEAIISYLLRGQSQNELLIWLQEASLCRGEERSCNARERVEEKSRQRGKIY